jgi:hypothetical protein
MKADFTIFFLLVLAVAAFVGWDSPNTRLHRRHPGARARATLPGNWERRRGGASGGMDQYKY